jgi:hypothetical protein
MADYDWSGNPIISPDTGGTTTGGSSSITGDISNFFGNITKGDFGKAFNTIGSVLGGGSGAGAQMAGLAGLASLLNNMGLSGTNQSQFAGYRKPIPTYTASREQNPIPTTATNAAGVPLLDTKGLPIPRRPGSGGITYFTPMKYVEKTTAAAGGGLMQDPSSPVQMYAQGGISTLGGYSDGGRLLRGPGDGVSDSIPASIEGKQPARLADGEFVIPARIVSELGNGSTEAGARKLYAMMDRIQKSRGKTVGKKKVAVNSRADKHLPA